MLLQNLLRRELEIDNSSGPKNTLLIRCAFNDFQCFFLLTFQIWEKMFEPLHCQNFGIGGDQTQHVLWRLQNGELENHAPKVSLRLVQTYR